MQEYSDQPRPIQSLRCTDLGWLLDHQPESAFLNLDHSQVWTAWREEDRNGSKTKVPYQSVASRSAADDRATWITREAAEAVASNLNTIGRKGVGIFLGGTGSLPMGGVDLDSCLDPVSKTLEPWAQEVIARLGSYAEISPSGTGVKVFFRYAADDLEELRAATATQWSKSWSRGSHVEIALHLGNRYFAVTDQHCPSTPREIRPVDRDSLLWLIQDAGPKFKANATGEAKDDSRSGRAMQLAAKTKRDGMALEDYRAALARETDLAEWAKDDRQVRRAWERCTAGLVIDESDFEDLPEAGAMLKVGIITARNGDIKPCLHNAILVLRKVNREQGLSIRKNDMTGQDEWRGGQLQDADLGMIRVAIEQAGMHNVGAALTTDAVEAVAKRDRYHPVQDWLKTLQHDGTRRMDSWLSRYLGVSDSPYSRAVGRAFLVAMVARVMRPGCKHDHVLVLGGEQGTGKSTACRILGGEWFGDNMPSIRDGAKEAGLYLRGHWLVELAELAPSRKAEAEDLKAFLTRATDEIRAPYARKADALPRQCVFVGTTNEIAFLRDMTGGRRFWPVTCGAIDIDGLARDREQLFAEAVLAFNAGEQWHLSREIEQLAHGEQEAAREEDPWESAIADQVAGDGVFNDPVQVTSARELLTKLGVPLERQNQSSTQRVARILKRMGWERVKNRDGKVWVRK